MDKRRAIYIGRYSQTRQEIQTTGKGRRDDAESNIPPVNEGMARVFKVTGALTFSASN
jgi:hypothetical protein